MNYLLFTYYDETVTDESFKTKEIATSISDCLSTGNVKYFFGPKFAIFHFQAKVTILDIEDVLFFIKEEIGDFEYFLTKKPTSIVSNFTKDVLDDFLSLKSDGLRPKMEGKKLKPNANKPKFDSIFDNISDLLNFKNKMVCNLSLDDLLDKILETGIDSLTTLEMEKLNEYSKNII